MKTHITLAMALLLLVPDVAQAQAGHEARPGGQEGGQQPQPAARPAPGRPEGGRPGAGARPGPIRPSPPTTRPSPPGRPGGPQIQPPRPGHGARPERPGQPHRPGRPDRPRPPGIGQPHRPGAGRPPNFRPVHARPFRFPRGYRYHRWTIGLLLPTLFLSSTYYYDDYGALGVGAPPPGYRWVRYGPDLLLVQLGTRRVADVIYGAFY